MDFLRSKTLLLVLTLSVKTICVETVDGDSYIKNGNSSYNCTLNKLLEDIFKINNNVSIRTNFVEDSEKAKEFLNGMNLNVSNIRNSLIRNNSQHTIVDGIIDSINMIKNNFTLTNNHETDATKINETFIIENVINSNKSIINSSMNNTKNLENKVKTSGSTSVADESNINKSNQTKMASIAPAYIEVMTIEPNNTDSDIRPSSNHIVDILKHLMPNFNTNITIAEKRVELNSSTPDAKNISTIVVTICNENFTKANVTFMEANETVSLEDKNKVTEFSDYNDDNSSMAAPHIDEVNYDEFIPEDTNLTLLEQRNVLAAADYGIQMMHELFSIKEPKLYSMGLWLDDTNPARYVAAFNAPSEDSAKYFRYGYASLQAATKLQQLHNGEVLEGRTEETLFPGVSALRNSALLEQCPLRGAPKCPPASKRYRTHDGTCNNFNRPRWGSTMTPVQRFLPPSYSDGLQAPRRSVFGGKLPSPREISALVHEDHDVETVTITHLLMQWGQFIDHDITSSSQSRGFNGSVPRCCKDGGRDFVSREFMHPECLPISVPSTDRFYGPLGVRCLEFVRSSPAPKDDCSLGWREQFNQVSAYLDASPLYGSSARQSDRLRLFRNGMLQYGRVQQRRPLLPPERSRKDELCRGGAVSTDCFKSGDNRVNEHPGLVAAHIVWLRQHNRMATELAHLNPHWSDEKIYQETRKIVGSMIQHITYKEFLPIVLGSEVMRLFDLDPQKKGFYKNYNPKVNPSPASSFGSAAFRFGHSLVQSSMVRFDRHHRPINNNVSLHDELTNPSNIWSVGAVDRLLLGMVNQPIQKRDEFITEELTNHLFQTPQFPFGMDLAAINIQRGRDHGIPAYTAWREPCGLTAIVDFEDLFRIMPSRAVRKLQDLYRNVDDIDLFTGGMAERPVIGGLVGPTFACIIAQQFSNLRKGDRFWYENGGFDSSFTPAQLQQIRRITLAQILCKTLDTIDDIQPFVFLAAGQNDNRRIPCTNGLLNNFDLSPWIEIDSALNDNNVDFEANRQTDAVTKKPDDNMTKKPKPTDEKDQEFSSSNKVTQNKPLPLTMTNSTKAQNSITKKKTTVKPNFTKGPDKLDKPTDVTVQKIDDKLDFRNKSKRYENSQLDDSDNRPHKQYYDYDNDYDEDKYSDEESSIYQQAVVVNNHRYQRPNKYNRPVIAVTENIDKVTYLINYVPRPARPTARPSSRPWKQSTRIPYNNDKDVVKVTYQTYEDTYRRPQQHYNSHSSTYYNNRLLDKTAETYDAYRRQRPDSPTTRYADNSQSSARASDFSRHSTKPTSSFQKATTKDEVNFSATTETLYRLVTFSHLGSYDSNADINEDLTKVITDEQKQRPKPMDINKLSGLGHTVEINNDPKLYSKDFTLEDEKGDKEDTVGYKFTTNIPPRLSTFIPSDLDLRSTLINEPNTSPHLRLDDKLSKTDTSGIITPGRYYYAANVLHRYPDVDATLAKTDSAKIGLDNRPIIKENYNSPGRPEDKNYKATDNIEERSSVDTMLLEDVDLERHSEQSEKGGKVRVVKPNEAPTHSVAFQVIPSENSPTTWAVYEEKSELHDTLPHAMPPVNSDPHALSELPRPISLATNNKNKRRKPQA